MWMPATTVKAVLGQQQDDDDDDRGSTTTTTTKFFPPEDSTTTTNNNNNKNNTGGCGNKSCNSTFQQQHDEDRLERTATAATVVATTTTVQATTDISVVSDHQDMTTMNNNEVDFLTGMYHHPSLDVSTATTATTTKQNKNNDGIDGIFSRGRLPSSSHQDQGRFYDDDYEEEELVFGPSTTESSNYSFDGVDENDDDDIDDDDDDLRSIVSFSSLSVDTFFSFDDFHPHTTGNSQHSMVSTTSKCNMKPNGEQQDHLLPMISPGGESTTTYKSNDSSTTDGDRSSFASSSSSSSYTPSSLKARASVATGSATKLWNGLQIHMINKIPAIPNLLSHGSSSSSSSSSSSHDSTTSPTSTSSRSAEQVQTSTGTNDEEHAQIKNSSSRSSKSSGKDCCSDGDRSGSTSIATNVVTETFQSWMNRRTASSSSSPTTPGGSSSKLDDETSSTTTTTLQTTRPQCNENVDDDDDDDAFGLGDGLDLPSASLHKVSNHDTDFAGVVDGNNNNNNDDDDDDDVNLTSPSIRDDVADDDDQCQQHRRRHHLRQYGVTPKRQVTPPELPQTEQQQQQQQQSRQRPFSFLSFETVDSSHWTFRSVSPMPSWVSTTTSGKAHGSSEVDGSNNDKVGEDDTDLSIGSCECDDVLLQHDNLNLDDIDFDDSASLGFDLFHPNDDDFELAAGLETESPDVFLHDLHDRDTEVMYKDDMNEDGPALAEGIGCSYSWNSTGDDLQRLRSGGGRDKFSRLQTKQACIPRQCSVSSTGGNDDDNDGAGSVHSSWPTEEDEDDYEDDASSNFFLQSDHTSISSTDSSQSEYVPAPCNRNNHVSPKLGSGRRRRQESPVRSIGQGKNKKRKKQDTTTTTKRIRKEEPKVKKYVEPTDQDVLLGRGGRSNHHPGNKVYRERVLELQAKYKTLSRDHKTAMSTSVVDWIQTQCGGNFLQFDVGGNSQDGPWYVVLDKTARSKVSQALREDHTKEGRAAKLARRRKNSTNKTKIPRKKTEKKKMTVKLGTPKLKPKSKPKKANNSHGTTTTTTSISSRTTVASYVHEAT